MFERYCFLFLPYLEIVRRPVYLRSTSDSVKTAEQVLKKGRTLEPFEAVRKEELKLFKAEEAPSRLYDLDVSLRDFTRSKKQYDADLAILEEQEAILWNKLVECVETAYGSYDPWAELELMLILS